jgi:Protein of unknown function (DUF2789)
MDTAHHGFTELFAQLGLPSDEASIHSFITAHGRLPDHVRLEEAPCWTAAQARLLRESLAQDADWATVVDRLNVALRNKA